MKKTRNYKKPILITAISIIAILGLNSFGQINSSIKNNQFLNEVNQQSESTSKYVHNQEIVDLAVNERETFVIFDDIDGSQSLMHWGTTNGYQNAQKLDIPLEQGDKLTKVYADYGVAFIVVEKADGTNSIYGYGDNGKRQITQDESQHEYTTPVLVKDGIYLSDITINEQTTSIFYQDGADLKVLSQGDDKYFGLGVKENWPNKITISEKTIANSKLINADAGIAHVGALIDFKDNDKDGLYTWGMNGNGQIGNGTYLEDGSGGVLPTKVEGIDDATEIYVGGNNTFAIAPNENGNGEKIYGWGASLDGQLGPGEKWKLSPFELTKLENLINNKGKSWSVIGMQSFNRGSSLLVDRGDKVERYIWGDQMNGQLGNGYNGEEKDIIDFTFAGEVKQGGESVTKDQLVAYDTYDDAKHGGTTLSVWGVDGFDSIGGYGSNMNGALSPMGGSTHKSTPIEIYEESQVTAKGVSGEKSISANEFVFDLSIDSNIIDPASFNFAIKQEGELINNNNVEVTGIQRNQIEDTVVSFKATTETTAEQNIGKVLNYSVSVDGGKTFGYDFQIGYDTGPAKIATLKSWDYESTKHDATINYVLDVPKDDPANEDSFASKVEIYDPTQHLLASDNSDGITSLEEGSILVDKNALGDPLKAGDTLALEIRVYGDKYDETKYTSENIQIETKPLDDAEGPKFDTLETNWINITEHEATLDYSFETDFNGLENGKPSASYADNYNSTINSVTITTEDSSLPITPTPTKVTTTEHNVDEHGTGIKKHTGSVDLSDLVPKQIYDSLELSINWRSDNWDKDTTSTVLLPPLTTLDLGAPAAPSVVLSEVTENTNPEGFTVNGIFDTKDYNPEEQLPAKIDSIDLMYELKEDEGNVIKATTKNFGDETTKWEGSYAISGLKSETEYNVWTEITYSAIGSEAFNNLKSTSEKISITTGAYEDIVISDFNWTPNTKKPSEGQFDIKVTSGHVGDDWYDPSFDPKTIKVKDNEGRPLSVKYITNEKTEGTYSFSLTGLQGGQTYEGVKISLENSNELEVSFDTADLLEPLAPIIEEPTVTLSNQTSADIEYSFTAESGDSKDYLETIVEGVELIDSKTSETLLSADNTNENGTFNLIGLEYAKEYSIKIRVIYSGGLIAESEDVKFWTGELLEAEPPVIEELYGDKSLITKTTVGAHYKIDVPNSAGYHPTEIKAIKTQLDGKNEKTIDPNKLEGSFLYDHLRPATEYTLKLIVEWDDAVTPIEGVLPVWKEIKITTLSNSSEQGKAVIESASIEMKIPEDHEKDHNDAIVSWVINDGSYGGAYTPDVIKNIWVVDGEGSKILVPSTNFEGTETIHDFREGLIWNDVKLVVETQWSDDPLEKLMEEQLISMNHSIDFTESVVEEFDADSNSFEFSLTAEGYNEDMAATLQVMTGDTSLETHLISSEIIPTESYTLEPIVLETKFTYEVVGLEPGTLYTNLSVISTDENIIMPEGGIHIDDFTTDKEDSKLLLLITAIVIGLLFITMLLTILKKKKPKTEEQPKVQKSKKVKRY